MSNQIAYPTPCSGPQIGLVPKDIHPQYITWADTANTAVGIKIDGIDAREALLALDLLRKKCREYEGLRITNAGSFALIQKMFRLEFNAEFPTYEMARQLGANIRSQDAEAVISVLRDCSEPY